jgi:hypothetical protein
MSILKPTPGGWLNGILRSATRLNILFRETPSLSAASLAVSHRRSIGMKTPINLKGTVPGANALLLIKHIFNVLSVPKMLEVS